MIYIPNPKALVYSQLQFISTSVPLPVAKNLVDYDSIYDAVSSEIYTLFVGDAGEAEFGTMILELPVQSLPGVQLSN